MQSITAAAAGSQIMLKVGESCDLVLAGNPTTGYQWEIAELDDSIVKPVGEMAFKPASTALGAGGQSTWHFQAVTTGQTPLKMIYRRSFEKGIPPAQTFEVQLVVKPAARR